MTLNEWLAANGISLSQENGPRSVNPFASGYFTPQDLGDGQATLGSGAGTDWMDWSSIPGTDAFMGIRNNGEGDVQSYIDAEGLSNWLRQNGYSMMESDVIGQTNGTPANWLRWIQDGQGNIVGNPTAMQNTSSSDLRNVATVLAIAGGAAAANGGFGAGSLSGAEAGAAAGSGSAGGSGAGLGSWSGWNFDPSAIGLGGAGGSGGGSMLGNFGWGDAIQIGGQLLNGYLGSNASGNAADAQLAAGREANALQRYMYDTTRADFAPYRQAGTNALSQIQSLLANPQSITSQPGYQFGMDQGMNALNRTAAGRGMTYSGQTMKDAQQFGQDYAGTKLDQSFNRLASLAGIGQTATGSTAQAGMNYGNQAGNTLQGMGNAQGSAYMGQANAWGQALGNLGNYWQNRNIYNQWGG